MTPMSLSGFFSRRSTSPAVIGLLSAKCRSLSGLIAISAVSDPEKKAEQPNSKRSKRSIISGLVSITDSISFS
jgi:hypothetical protein